MTLSVEELELLGFLVWHERNSLVHEKECFTAQQSFFSFFLVGGRGQAPKRRRRLKKRKIKLFSFVVLGMFRKKENQRHISKLQLKQDESNLYDKHTSLPDHFLINFAIEVIPTIPPETNP